MFSDFFEQKNKQDQFITEHQFEEIAQAILAGKYSWACFLILQAKGQNPVDYIPYRTYNRLIKNNCLGKGKSNKKDQAEKDPVSMRN